MDNKTTFDDHDFLGKQLARQIIGCKYPCLIRLPIGLLIRIIPFVFCKWHVLMHVNRTKFERKTSLEYHHMTYIDKKKLIRELY